MCLFKVGGGTEEKNMGKDCKAAYKCKLENYNKNEEGMAREKPFGCRQ